MYQASHRDLDRSLASTLDRVGVIGTRFREDLVRDLKAKVVFRSARDTVELIGQPGTGRHQVARAAHGAAQEVLGRQGALVDFDCGLQSTDPREFQAALGEAAERASGGSLLLDRYMQLDEGRRGVCGRLLEKSEADVLALAVSAETSKPVQTGYRPATRIRLKPVHEREEDIWELIDHFFTATIADCGGPAGCRGFSRQAKADIAEVVRETNLASVRRLRDVVRDLVFEAMAAGPLGLKITSDTARLYLERNFRQTEESRQQREATLIDSQFDAMIERSLLERLGELHSIPMDLLERQVAVQREIVGYIDGVPRSYRNIMDKLDDINRASLWLMTGATTQAEFRRFFGDERFMRPTKSVAWAFYNRVFKRDS